MKQNQRVYIKGDPKRGNEIIKFLENLGGNNFSALDGDNSKCYYYIDPRGRINCMCIDNSLDTSFLMEFYKEISLPRWKPKYRDYYYYIASNGIIKQEMSNNTALDDSYYEFGNCFKTFEEAETTRDEIKELLNHKL